MNRSTLSGIQPVMKSLLLAGGLASGLVVGIVALPVPAVAAEICQGQAATLVGSPDMSLVGTDGDDVIVTNGSRVILALDGNDRVCVTGKSGQVYAGFGDDVVDTTAASSGRSFLGPGADTYLGGPGPDFVKAAGDPGSGAAIGTSRSTSSTSERARPRSTRAHQGRAMPTRSPWGTAPRRSTGAATRPAARSSSAPADTGCRSS